MAVLQSIHHEVKKQQTERGKYLQIISLRKAQYPKLIMNTYNSVIRRQLIQLKNGQTISTQQPPHSWFGFPWFQLPVVNHSLKILNGKFQINNSYVFKLCSEQRDETLHCPTLSHPGCDSSLRLASPLSRHCHPSVTGQPSGLSDRLRYHRAYVHVT